MTRKPKLELTWVGKEQRPRLEPRILLEDGALSYHAGSRREGDLFDNRLIQGDNLLALKALEAEFAGQVKCVFIDPPYNTGSAFEHYDDGLEHSLWLSMMRDRLEIIRRLLRPDGSLWVTLDDNEAHYFKVMADEVFGRGNFIADIAWQKRTSRENRAAIGSAHDHVLLYAKKPAIEWKDSRNTFPARDTGFSNLDNDPKGEWRPIPFTAQGFRAAQMYEITLPSGRVVTPPRGRCWGATRPTFDAYLAEGRVYFGRNGDAQPTIKKYRGEESGLVPMSWWPSEEFGDNTQSKREILELFDEDNPFQTPKPEKLLQKILTIATNPGDVVLDSFAGSGTTGAVAHKMGRRWIMVELGDHAVTHIVPRVRKVIDGEDPGGVTAATGWKGGGGFRFQRLAPSLLQTDKWGREVISPEYDAPMLARAVCQLEGFTYAPSETEYWNHGRSSERDFIYVTTQTLTHDQLRDLSEQVGEDRSLLVLCAAYRGDARGLLNLTVKKIPDHVRDRCEWGRDDYSLRVAALPETPAEEDVPVVPRPGRARGGTSPDLFAEEGA